MQANHHPRMNCLHFRRSICVASQSNRNGASCRTWAILSELALHSVTPPNEEVANNNRTAFTRENIPCSHVEFKRILSLFFITSIRSLVPQHQLVRTIDGIVLRLGLCNQLRQRD